MLRKLCVHLLLTGCVSAGVALPANAAPVYHDIPPNCRLTPDSSATGSGTLFDERGFYVGTYVPLPPAPSNSYSTVSPQSTFAYPSGSYAPSDAPWRGAGGWANPSFSTSTFGWSPGYGYGYRYRNFRPVTYRPVTSTFRPHISRTFTRPVPMSRHVHPRCSGGRRR